MENQVKALFKIKRQIKPFVIPSVTKVSFSQDPYKVLISCILSLRTKDKATVEASSRLFKVAGTPRSMVKLPVSRLQRLIYPVGFYRNKARVILGISKDILRKFNGRVPGQIDALLSFKGVGRKTANLVLGLGFGIPAICVDVHVHRISNRLGWIRTKDPYDTEMALQKMFPRKMWIELNTILVTFGQNICVPVSPFCSRCSVNRLCRKIGITKSR